MALLTSPEKPVRASRRHQSKLAVSTRKGNKITTFRLKVVILLLFWLRMAEINVKSS